MGPCGRFSHTVTVLEPTASTDHNFGIRLVITNAEVHQILLLLAALLLAAAATATAAAAMVSMAALAVMMMVPSTGLAGRHVRLDERNGRAVRLLWLCGWVAALVARTAVSVVAPWAAVVTSVGVAVGVSMMA